MKMAQTIKENSITFFPKALTMTQPQEQESFTQVPNSFFDKLLEEIDTLSEMKITLALIRKICGWVEIRDGKITRKEGDEVSFSQFVEITGLSRPMVKLGLEAALKRGSIVRTEKGKGFYYQLNLFNFTSDGYVCARNAKLAQTRELRNQEQSVETIGLATKPPEGVPTKPLIGLATKHTKEIEPNKKEINNTEPKGSGPATIDLPDVAEIKQSEPPTISKSKVSSHIPPSDKSKREKKVKQVSPYTKDPRLLKWRDIAKENDYEYWPNRDLQKMIYDHIPPDQLDRWDFTIHDWLKHSHKIHNVAGMIKVFWFGWEAFYSGKADRMNLPLVKQLPEGVIADVLAK